MRHAAKMSAMRRSPRTVGETPTVRAPMLTLGVSRLQPCGAITVSVTVGVVISVPVAKDRSDRKQRALIGGKLRSFDILARVRARIGKDRRFALARLTADSL